MVVSHKANYGAQKKYGEAERFSELAMSSFKWVALASGEVGLDLQRGAN
jgi:hypothetical protein